MGISCFQMCTVQSFWSVLEMFALAVMGAGGTGRHFWEPREVQGRECQLQGQEG